MVHAIPAVERGLEFGATGGELRGRGGVGHSRRKKHKNEREGKRVLRRSGGFQLVTEAKGGSAGGQVCDA